MKTSLLAGLGVLATLAGAPAHAQTRAAEVRVMIAADDADPLSVVRSSDIFHRLQIPLNEEMRGGGYFVLFEDAIAAENRWEIQDRSSKQKSLELAKVSCKSGRATLCPRVLILVKIRAAALDLGFGTSADVRMTGEMIDVSTNRVLGGWEAPKLEFPGPKACNNVCLENIVGDNARAVALTLADTLRKMLDHQVIRGTSTETAGAVTGRSSGSETGLVNSYLLTFERFQMEEVLPLMQVIERHFPETIEVGTPQGGAGSFSFNVSSRLKSEKMLGLINLMMGDRGYDLNKVKISTSGSKFIIDRIVDDGFRPRSARPF